MIQSLDEALVATDEELFSELGSRAYILDNQIVLKKSLGGNNEDGGRRVFEYLLPRIRLALCDDWNACAKAKHYKDKAELVMVICDTLIAANIAPIPMATIAVLCVRMGINKLCNCEAT